MPLCGFDEAMLDGLGMFYKGLAKAVIRKAKEKNISIEDSIKIELNDMGDFLEKLQILGNELNKNKLIGITMYAKTFYLGALSQAKEKGIPIEESMEKQIQETRNFLFGVDNHYYSYIEGKKDNPMLELVKWIEGRGK
ncbi:MAG: hypothetical protein Q7S21_01260 [archaeon]|nr:hypothetical protein [archaeon]